MTGGGRLGSGSEGSGRGLMGSFVVKLSFNCFSIDGGEEVGPSLFVAKSCRLAGLRVSSRVRQMR